jgi:hypothetical protein
MHERSHCFVLHAGLRVLQLPVQHQATMTSAQHTATFWHQHQHSACQEPCWQAPALPLGLHSIICLVLGTITTPAWILQAGAHQLSAWVPGRRSSSSRVRRVSGAPHLDLVNIIGESLGGGDCYT